MYTEDENGFVTIEKNPISKSGVFPYLGSQISSELEPNRVYKVYRPPEELNNPQTIDSFKLIAWIPHHEMLGDDFTPAEEVGVQGITGEDVFFENGTLYAKLKLLGKDLKEKIKKGLKELSCGFRCSWDLTSGITQDGEPYDVIQRNIRGNHLASVSEGRMGHDVRVAMDQIIISLSDFSKENEEESMDLSELIESVKSLSERIDGIAQDMKNAVDAKDKDKDDKDNASDGCSTKDEAKDKKDDDDDKKDAQDESIQAVMDKFEKLEKKVNSLSAMDSNTVIREINERNDFGQKVANAVGQFDYSLMSKSEVAKYGLEKLGIAQDSSDSVSLLQGYLLAQQSPKYVQDVAQDSAVSKNIPELTDLGI